MRPTFKHVHPVYQTKPGLLRMGAIADLTYDIEDPDGSIHKLVQLLDGTRTIQQVHEQLVIEFPRYSLGEVEEAVYGLNQLGFLYDSAREQQTVLSAVERERFKANIAYFSHYASLDQAPSEAQEKLKQARITVIGSGGFGSSLLLYLAGLGVQHVRLVDFDHVSISNLNRQVIFKESDMGRLKIDVACEFIGQLYSDMQLETVEMELRTPADADRVVQGSDLVLLAADQPAFVITRLVNEACVKHGIPMMQGAINAMSGRFSTVVPGETGCADCRHLESVLGDDEYVEQLTVFLNTGQVMPTATLAPQLFMITSMLATEVVKWLTGRKVEMHSLGQVVEFDFHALEKTVTPWRAHPSECPTCGSGSHDTPFFQLMRRLEEQHAPIVLKY